MSARRNDPVLRMKAVTQHAHKATHARRKADRREVRARMARARERAYCDAIGVPMPVEELEPGSHRRQHEANGHEACAGSRCPMRRRTE